MHVDVNPEGAAFALVVLALLFGIAAIIVADGVQRWLNKK